MSMYFMLLRGFPALFRPFWPGKFPIAPNQHRPPPDLRWKPCNTAPPPFPQCAFPHPLQNRVPRVQVLLPLPKKSGIASAVPDFFVSERKDLAARFARRPTCGACRGALVACGDRPAPTEAAAETKSFCPYHKTGENTGFSPVFFLHVLHGFGVHFGSKSGFSHLV